MSTSDPTNIFAWVYADEQRLHEEGGQKAAIVEAYRRYNRAAHNDHGTADAAISEAIAAAQATGESRWELFLRHWRLQLWLHDDINRALPEAVDLLSLATDERLRDVPQRICAYHDVVDCYVSMDPAGYAEDIAANSQDVLAQLPRKHPCADCARMHMAHAASARGQEQEAETWLARFHADAYDIDWCAWHNSIGEVYGEFGKWEQAENAYTRACELARKRGYSDIYFIGLLGRVESLARRGEPRALEVLREARHVAKYQSHTFAHARLLEVEGYAAEAGKVTGPAKRYFLEAARRYLALGRFRASTLTALHALDLEGGSEEDRSELLSVAARAVGSLPEGPTALHERLRAHGGEPISPPAKSSTEPDAHQPGETEHAAYEASLRAHLANGNPRGVAMALYQLGRWHANHEAVRAAVDYFILNAVLERLLELPIDDREDALKGLHWASERLPEGTVESALKATEAGPPELIRPLVAQMPGTRWAWLVRGVTAEWQGKPVVEPEPPEEGGNGNFFDFLDYAGTMTALILRFREQANQASIERWAGTLDEIVTETREKAQGDPEAEPTLAMISGMAALARGADPQQVLAGIPQPLDGPVRQMVEMAALPVWRHAGPANLDFLVEQAAQRTVSALRRHDEHRTTRLENLAFRFELMNMDLAKEKDLLAIAHFLSALHDLALANGEQAPSSARPELQEPFDAMFAAVVEASREPDPQPPAPDA